MNSFSELYQFINSWSTQKTLEFNIIELICQREYPVYGCRITLTDLSFEKTLIDFEYNFNTRKTILELPPYSPLKIYYAIWKNGYKTITGELSTIDMFNENNKNDFIINICMNHLPKNIDAIFQFNRLTNYTTK